MFSKFTGKGPTGPKPAAQKDWLSRAHGTDDDEKAAAQIAEHQRRTAEAAAARDRTATFMDGVRARVKARAAVAENPETVVAHPSISPKNTR